MKTVTCYGTELAQVLDQAEAEGLRWTSIERGRTNSEWRVNFFERHTTQLDLFAVDYESQSKGPICITKTAEKQK